jgi:hypothetical protein
MWFMESAREGAWRMTMTPTPAVEDLDRLESAARGELGAKSLGEKLHAADMEHEHPGSTRPWIDLSDEGRAVWERIALAFAASLTHDETANAVTLSLISALRASEAERERLNKAVLAEAASAIRAEVRATTAEALAKEFRGVLEGIAKRDMGPSSRIATAALSRTRPSGGDAVGEQGQ